MMKKRVKDYISTPEGYKQFRDKVDQILLHFDFEKVQKVMKTLNWTWYCWTDELDNSHCGEVPSLFALRQTAYKLLLEAVENEESTGIGGFEVQCYVYDNFTDEEGTPTCPEYPDDFEHSVCLNLQFVVVSYGDIY